MSVVLPPWLTIGQTAEYCGVDRTEVYHNILQNLQVRRIGVRGGVNPLGRLIRVDLNEIDEQLMQPLNGPRRARKR